MHNRDTVAFSSQVIWLKSLDFPPLTNFGVKLNKTLDSVIHFCFLLQRRYPGKFTFATALQYIGIVQVGNAHSAIDDAKTLATMMSHLYNNGAEISKVTDWR